MCSNTWEMVSKIQGGKCTDSSLCLKKGSEERVYLMFPSRKFRVTYPHAFQSFTVALFCLDVSHRHNSQDNFPFWLMSVSCRERLLSSVPLWFLRSRSDLFLSFSSPQTWIISKSTPEVRCQSERDRGWCCCAERRLPREVSPYRSLLLEMISAWIN